MKPFLILLLTALCSFAASPTREYPCRVTAVHDGDTFDVEISIGFDLLKKDSVRLAGLDTPELVTPEGKVAREAVVKLIDSKDITLVLTLDKNGNPRREKYGRLLATVLIGKDSLNQIIIDQHIGRPYSGGKKEPWGPADSVSGP